jgi:hypothetical protein
VLSRFELMSRPHCEAGAQDWWVVTQPERRLGDRDVMTTCRFVIPVTAMSPCMDRERDDLPLRIRLYQPSPIWKRVGEILNHTEQS